MKRSDIKTAFQHFANVLNQSCREGRSTEEQVVQAAAEFGQWVNEECSKPDYVDDRDQEQLEKDRQELIRLAGNIEKPLGAD